MPGDNQRHERVEGLKRTRDTDMICVYWKEKEIERRAEKGDEWKGIRPNELDAPIYVEWYMDFCSTHYLEFWGIS